MKRFLIALTTTLVSTLALASTPSTIPMRIPVTIPSTVPGGGSVGFKWITEPSDQSVNEGAELAFSVSLPSAAGYQSCIPSERMTQGPSTHRPGHIRGRHRMPGLEPTP